MIKFSIRQAALQLFGQPGKPQGARALPRANVRGVFAFGGFVLAGLLSFNTFAASEAGTAKEKATAPITINLTQYKVVKDEQGKLAYVDAALVVPGDIVEYRAVYSNRSNSVLPVVATLPIPESMEYVQKSAKSNAKAAYTVATKEASYAQEPLQQKVTTASGATLSQPVPYASYRFVRWDLGRLSPGSSVEVSVQTKVSEDLEKVAATDRTPIQVSSSFAK